LKVLVDAQWNILSEGYDSIGGYGPLQVEKDGLRGLIDFDGNLIEALGSYKSIMLTDQGAVYNTDAGMYYKTADFTSPIYDLQDKVRIVAPEYGSIIHMDNGQFALLNETDAFIVDSYGNQLQKFSDVLAFGSEYPIEMYKKSGNIYYDYKSDIMFGQLIVTKDSKFGLSKEDGELIIPIDYDGIGLFSDGLAKARKGTLWGFIDTDGEVVGKIAYERVRPFFYPSYYAAVKKDGLWGLIDRSGKLIEPFRENLLSMLPL